MQVRRGTTMDTAKERGFSLVELLVVVGILAIIFSIVIPYWLSTRAAAQAASAKGDLKTLHSAEVSYYTGAGMGSYGTLTQLENQKLIPHGFSTSDTNYERFNYTGTLTLSNANSNFSIVASPIAISPNTPSFYLDDSGAVRYSTSAPATSTSTPIASQ